MSAAISEALLFDAVCEFATLHHALDPAAVVGEMLRVAKKTVFLSDCNRFDQGHLLLRLLKLGLYQFLLSIVIAHRRDSEGKKLGGLGSSHTAPCGTAVPARPPTRSS